MYTSFIKFSVSAYPGQGRGGARAYSKKDRTTLRIGCTQNQAVQKGKKKQVPTAAR